MLVALVGIVAVAVTPSTTKQGIDYVVSTRKLPLYVKVLDFLDRDANYRVVAKSITAGMVTDQLRAMAIFEWTRTNIRSVPPDFPVVDDHIWHIIVRGHGADDQKADVFTTLLTYAGVPAYWIFLEYEGRRLPISFVRVSGTWRVYDVANGFIFRNRQGEPATVEEVVGDPALVKAVGDRYPYKGLPYTIYFRDFRPPVVPDILRAELQMFLPRLLFEMKRLVGLGGRQWDPRIASQEIRMTVTAVPFELS